MQLPILILDPKFTLRVIDEVRRVTTNPFSTTDTRGGSDMPRVVEQRQVFHTRRLPPAVKPWLQAP
jgi:hypothetical protein